MGKVYAQTSKPVVQKIVVEFEPKEAVDLREWMGKQIANGTTSYLYAALKSVEEAPEREQKFSIGRPWG